MGKPHFFQTQKQMALKHYRTGLIHSHVWAELIYNVGQSWNFSQHQLQTKPWKAPTNWMVAHLEHVSTLAAKNKFYSSSTVDSRKSVAASSSTVVYRIPEY